MPAPLPVAAGASLRTAGSGALRPGSGSRPMADQTWTVGAARRSRRGGRWTVPAA